MKKIRIAVIGVGNCASSLLQGIYYYRNRKADDACGLMHWMIGGYKPGDIEVVAAWDIDSRKVGKDVACAIFAPPNCTHVFQRDIPPTGVKVLMGHVGDSLSAHMEKYPENRRFVLSRRPEATRQEVVACLTKARPDVLLNYLPVGSEKAAHFYMECALEAGVAVINNMPVFIASNKTWAKRFRQRNIPIIGDDVKSQIGATIIHRSLTNLFRQRGVNLDHTYQLNFGGNTDFMNMLERERLESKKISKTGAVTSMIPYDLGKDNIHVGPSDYVPWLTDRKWCYIRMEGTTFGNVPLNLEAKLEVWDSPNSAGVIIDAVRCAKLALDRGLSGPIVGPSSYFFKTPPKQFKDNICRDMTEAFIKGD